MTNNERFPGNDIHETALIADGVQIGTGNYIGPYCVIGFPPEWKGKEESSGKVIIGDNNRLTGMVTVDSGTDTCTLIEFGVYIMKHAHIGHDADISEGCTIACGAKIGGKSTLEHGVTVGLNAVIHQNVTVPAGCMIGASSFVGKKSLLIPNGKYAGVPVRYLGENVRPKAQERPVLSSDMNVSYTPHSYYIHQLTENVFELKAELEEHPSGHIIGFSEFCGTLDECRLEMVKLVSDRIMNGIEHYSFYVTPTPKRKI